MKNFLIIVTLAAAMFAGCIKGPKGDTGTAGTNGTNGVNGAATLETIDVAISASQWQGGTTGYYYFDVADTAVTVSVMNTGTVNVFYEDNTGAWLGMPYSEYNNNSGAVFLWDYNYTPGNVRIFVQNAAGGTITFAAHTFKIVVIPGQ